MNCKCKTWSCNARVSDLGYAGQQLAPLSVIIHEQMHAIARREQIFMSLGEAVDDGAVEEGRVLVDLLALGTLFPLTQCARRSNDEHA